eukprot:1152646-Pelagomonas_calceolata.AAC.6
MRTQHFVGGHFPFSAHTPQLFPAVVVPQESDPSPRALKRMAPANTLILNKSDHTAQCVVDQARPMKSGKRVRGPWRYRMLTKEWATAISAHPLGPEVALIEGPLLLYTSPPPPLALSAQ